MIAKGVFSVGKNVLMPSDGRAQEIMGKLKVGDRVLINIHKARNPEHNALAHAVFQKIADAIGMPMEAVKLWMKWESGRVDLVKLPTGRYIANPKSFSFEAMSQQDFQSFWDDVLPIISEKILPKMPKAVYDEILGIIAGKPT